MPRPSPVSGFQTAHFSRFSRRRPHLDPTAVVAHLKMQPWQQANRFIGGASAAQAFARYAAAGDGLEVLKTKFAANPSTVTPKWNELAAWVALQQKPLEQ